MTKSKTYLAISLVLVLAVAVLGGVLAQPVWAQVKAALVRDIDTPALAPFRGGVDFTFAAGLSVQNLLTTVPKGKRLVIEQVSYRSTGDLGDELVALALHAGHFTRAILIIEINRPHVSGSGFSMQDGSQPEKAYFEAGEEVWVAGTHSTGAFRSVEVHVSGYYVTL